MKIVSLTKTFGGHEWVKYMIESIYPFVDNLVFVNSDISWIGRKGNKCKREIAKFDDKNNKIVSLDYDTKDQLEQCNIGFEYIKNNLDCDYIMLVDTDEIWDSQNLMGAIKYIKRFPNYNTYKCRLKTYIKTPFWQVHPCERIEPVCFVKPSLTNFGEHSRCYDVPHFTAIHGIFFHHYVYVREKFNDVLEKIITSHVSENTEYMDMSYWIPNVWNKLPDVKNFHPAVGFHHHWKSIKQITHDESPEVLRKDYV